MKKVQPIGAPFFNGVIAMESYPHVDNCESVAIINEFSNYINNFEKLSTESTKLIYIIHK